MLALVLPFVITVTYAPSAAASDAWSEAAGDAGTSSRPSDNADEAAPPAPEGLVALQNPIYSGIGAHQHTLP